MDALDFGIGDRFGLGEGDAEDDKKEAERSHV